jgi:hypothetical protein
MPGQMIRNLRHRRLMPMKNSPHPGLHVRYDCLEALGLSVTAAAKVLGVTRQALQQSRQWQEWDFTGDGYSPLKGLWRSASRLAEDADGLRSSTHFSS